jgi:hypothetical protein
MLFGKRPEEVVAEKVHEVEALGQVVAKEHQKAMMEKLIDPGLLKVMLLDENLANEIRLHHEGAASVVPKCEAIRKRDLNEIKDSNLRKRVHIVRSILSMSSEIVCRFAVDNRLPKDVILPAEIKPGETKVVESLFKDFKTTYVLHVLTYCRDQHIDRKIQENDIHDMAMLAIAIPYCRIVVTEKFWTNIAKHEHLDRDYETAILGSPAELADYL